MRVLQCERQRGLALFGVEPPRSTLASSIARERFTVGRVDAPITLTFPIGANGRATALVMRENGSRADAEWIR